MRHISEVLRLAAQGHSQREISTSVGISRTSVRNYLARAERALPLFGAHTPGDLRGPHHGVSVVALSLRGSKLTGLAS